MHRTVFIQKPKVFLNKYKARTCFIYIYMHRAVLIQKQKVFIEKKRTITKQQFLNCLTCDDNNNNNNKKNVIFASKKLLLHIGQI